jgi:hypothetical protein
MHERRRHTREEVYFPVQIDSKEKSERVGVARNSSASGLLIGTPSRFSVGEELDLTFTVQYGGPYQKKHGRVVRVTLDDQADLFRQLVAVEIVPKRAA